MPSRIRAKASLLGGPPLIPQVCEGPGVPGLVSVLLPTYNRAYIVLQAIHSVLNQTYQDIELIVVDDGSTDGTRALLEPLLAEAGSRVRYIHQPNGGLAAARNAGLAAARGEFVAFQDSDDAWLPWKLAAQVALMRRLPELAVVWTDMRAVDDHGVELSPRHLRTMYGSYSMVDCHAWLKHTQPLREAWPDQPDELGDVLVRWGDIFSPMFAGNLIHPPTALMRRTSVQRSGGLDRAFSLSCEDYEFFWRVCREGQGALIEAPGMLYRVNAGDQLTIPYRHLYKARGYLLALQRALARDRDRIQLSRADINKCLGEAHHWVGEQELLAPDGKQSAALRAYWKSLWLKRPDARVLFLMLLGLTVPKPAIDRMRHYRQRRREMRGAAQVEAST